MDKKKQKFLNPGSDKAIAAGCKCAIMDNCRGRGYMGQTGMYSMDGGCPLHGHLLSKGKKGKR